MRTMLATACLMGVAIALTVTPVHAKKEAVEQAAKQWADAAAKRDPVAIAAVYAEDAVLLPPNSDFVRGRAAITEVWKGMLDMGLTLVTPAGAEVEVEGNMAYRMGTYQVLASDGTELDKGKYIEVWKKSGKGWFVTRDIWNSSMPMPEPHQH